jgi:5-formyltetrahydrofolate cyclo-ligase
VQDWDDIRRWRKATRAELLAARQGMESEQRSVCGAAISAALADVVGSRAWHCVGLYWPFRGEYDARPVAETLRVRGAQLALPEVVVKAAPLVFRSWRPGDRLVSGIWDIPVPANGEAVQPDLLLVPLVGFDSQRFRLGYGGGYYDRTIAAMPVRPYVVGIGFAMAQLPTIHPQSHDIPMDVIVTERHVL